jgi:hypothetical protein
MIALYDIYECTANSNATFGGSEYGSPTVDRLKPTIQTEGNVFNVTQTEDSWRRSPAREFARAASISLEHACAYKGSCARCAAEKRS